MKLVCLGSTQAWADRVGDRLIARVRQQPAVRLCLATGVTPVRVYERVRHAVQKGDLSFRDAEIVLLDEFGGVPPDDPGRCDRMLQRDLIDHIDLPAARFHGFTFENGIEQACRAHEAAVASGCDLTVLGIGTNGHIGMNEPGSSPDSLTRRVELSSETTRASARYFGREHDLPTWGVTMGIGTILRSTEIWLLATGPQKAAVVRAALEGPISSELPASLLRTHRHAVLFADSDAASQVSSPA